MTTTNNATSAAAKYNTAILHVNAVLAAMRNRQPAATAPTAATPPAGVYTSDRHEPGETTKAIGRRPVLRDRSLDDTTDRLTKYAVDRALSRQPAEDPPLYQQLLAELSARRGQEGGED